MQYFWVSRSIEYKIMRRQKKEKDYAFLYIAIVFLETWEQMSS